MPFTAPIFTKLTLAAQIFILNFIKIEQTVSPILVKERPMYLVSTQSSFLTP